LGQEIEIEEACEPTDIIWENRHIKDEERFNKKVIVGLIVFILLMISVVIIFFC
jgi:hypothetical protein